MSSAHIVGSPSNASVGSGRRFVRPRRQRRSLSAGTAVILLVSLSIYLWVALFSYTPSDPSWNAAASGSAENLAGRAGAHIADLLLQTFGLCAFALPLLMLVFGITWLNGRDISSMPARLVGTLLLLLGCCTGLAFLHEWQWFGNSIHTGGLLGIIARDALTFYLNTVGTLLAVATMLTLGLYLCTRFSIFTAADWLDDRITDAQEQDIRNGIIGWLAVRRAQRDQKAAERAALREMERERKAEERAAKKAARKQKKAASGVSILPQEPADTDLDRVQRIPIADMPWQEGAPPGLQADLAAMREAAQQRAEDTPPWDTDEPVTFRAATGTDTPAEPEPEPEAEIPIETIEDLEEAPRETWEQAPVPLAGASSQPPAAQRIDWRLPSTEILQAAAPRNLLDELELKETATRIKSKFEEFNVFGNVVQINPGPVVTTFEFKPEAGIKYSKMTNLTEDLCLGLQAESVMIERIPGKPTVGIEVPNTKRDTIVLRQILESDEFRTSPSRLTFCLGKDIRGRIKVTSMEQMPHLLIAGSTGAGKSVMLNALIVSILYKSTPDQVRLIMVDPKQVELGIYEGVPHLLTPVITDPKKANVALGNAVIEMERRLRLLASYGARNIEQFNKKVEKLREQSDRTINLFEEEEDTPEPLPFVLIIIDELADLMMLEGRNVEASITRLAQMARAVGIHLVVATQRPSVDVITGLIKANFPARMSFRVATRVDSRTILDVMGAEHLLGRGDMLFLPPGTSRLTRMHGAFVQEQEINSLVSFWKGQAQPDYDASFLVSPDTEAETTDGDEEEDPAYRDAVNVVLEMGKASTSILQRRLRLGYGRAARILDRMQREGIIGPPDGPRPREVLRRPDWAD
jgi:DNA segregation ATPase FtsK/SpoIIIE, S-DNA-T family